MRSLITVYKANGMFSISASGKFGGGYSNLLVRSAEDAAAKTASEALRYCTSEGCDICAPREVRELLPAFVGRDIKLGMGF
jgi:hypothetical protein